MQRTGAAEAEAELTNLRVLGATVSRQARIRSDAIAEVSKWIWSASGEVAKLRTWRETGFVPTADGPVLLRTPPWELVDQTTLAKETSLKISSPLLHLAARLAKAHVLNELLLAGTPVRCPSRGPPLPLLLDRL